MKVVILAGGFGTRISEESISKPKPMIELGGMPILWHIMKMYSAHGYNEFIICMGYKANVIRDFFANYYLYTSDVTFDMSDNNKMIVHRNYSEPWKVTLVDTRLNTMTGGRIKRIQKYVGNEPFLLTYGDGVSDVDINKLVKFHNEHGHKCTITTVSSRQRFGVINIEKDGLVSDFREKSDEDGAMINGGFMVCEPSVFDYIKGDKTVFEKEPLENLAKEGELDAYRHKGFWQCMDTKRDHDILEEMWEEGKAPWKTWKD